jgi:hypothetical protein
MKSYVYINPIAIYRNRLITKKYLFLEPMNKMIHK